MKNKSSYIIGIINAVIAITILIYLYIKVPNAKIIVVPFLICGFAMIGKNISLLMEKRKYAKLFDKLFILSFLVFCFVFLIYWCYTSIISKDYILLLFSIPFWIIGIVITRKEFF